MPSPKDINDDGVALTGNSPAPESKNSGPPALSPLVINFVKATVNHQIQRLDDIQDKDVITTSKIIKLKEALKYSTAPPEKGEKKVPPQNLQQLLTASPTSESDESIMGAAAIQRGFFGNLVNKETETLQNVTSSSNLYAIMLFDSNPGETDTEVLMDKLNNLTLTETNDILNDIGKKYLPGAGWEGKHQIKVGTFENEDAKLTPFKTQVRQSLTFLTQMQSLTAGNDKISEINLNFSPDIDIQKRLDEVNTTLKNMEASLVIDMEASTPLGGQSDENISILLGLAQKGLTIIDAQRSTLHENAVDALITKVTDTDSVDNATTIKATEEKTAALIEKLRGTSLDNIALDLQAKVDEAIEAKVEAVQAICATKVTGFRAEQTTVIANVNKIETPTIEAVKTIEKAEAARDVLISQVNELYNPVNFAPDLAIKLEAAVKAQKIAITEACDGKVNEFKVAQEAIIARVTNLDITDIGNTTTIEGAEAEQVSLIAQVTALSNADNFDPVLATQLEAAVANITSNINQEADKRVTAIKAKEAFLSKAAGIETTNIDQAPDLEAVQEAKVTLISQLTNGAKGLDPDFTIEVNEAIQATTVRIDTATTKRVIQVKAKQAFDVLIDNATTPPKIVKKNSKSETIEAYDAQENSLSDENTNDLIGKMSEVDAPAAKASLDSARAEISNAKDNALVQIDQKLEVIEQKITDVKITEEFAGCKTPEKLAEKQAEVSLQLTELKNELQSEEFDNVVEATASIESKQEIIDTNVPIVSNHLIQLVALESSYESESSKKTVINDLPTTSEQTSDEKLNELNSKLVGKLEKLETLKSELSKEIPALPIDATQALGNSDAMTGRQQQTTEAQIAAVQKVGAKINEITALKSQIGKIKEVLAGNAKTLISKLKNEQPFTKYVDIKSTQAIATQCQQDINVLTQKYEDNIAQFSTEDQAAIKEALAEKKVEFSNQESAAVSSLQRATQSVASTIVEIKSEFKFNETTTLDEVSELEASIQQRIDDVETALMGVDEEQRSSLASEIGDLKTKLETAPVKSKERIITSNSLFWENFRTSIE